jgi:hypothetical protein
MDAYWPLTRDPAVLEGATKVVSKQN